MNDHLMETLSAFTDGEPVNPESLAKALADEDARDALLDFALIRAMAADDAAQPEDAHSSERWPQSPARRFHAGRRVAAAAAAVLLVGLGLSIGVWLEGRDAVSRHGPAALPAATREVRFTEGVDWFRKS